MSAEIPPTTNMPEEEYECENCGGTVSQKDALATTLEVDGNLVTLPVYEYTFVLRK